VNCIRCNWAVGGTECYWEQKTECDDHWRFNCGLSVNCVPSFHCALAVGGPGSSPFH
jgi:hypothetical protein